MLGQIAAMPVSYVPWFFLLSTLGSALYLPMWIVSVGLIVFFQALSSAIATLVVRRFLRDARWFSAWHVARWAVLGLLGGVGVAAVILAGDGRIPYPMRASGAATAARRAVVGSLALLALPAGVVLGTVRGSRYPAVL